MKKPKTCMVTCHPNLPSKKTDYIREQLQKEILQAIEDGYTHFISGFSSGADLIFAEIIAEQKNRSPITLEAAIPYRNRVNSKECGVRRLIAKCDIVGIHSEKYSVNCNLKTGRIMVGFSSRVIAVCDKRKNDRPPAAMCYANLLGREVRVIEV